MPPFPVLNKEDRFLGLPTVGAAAPSGAVMARRWGKPAITGITPGYPSREQECAPHLSSYRAPSAHRLAGWHSGSSGHPPGVPSRPHFLSGARLRSRASQGTRGAGILGQPHITVRCPPPCNDLVHIPLLQQGSAPAYSPRFRCVSYRGCGDPRPGGAPISSSPRAPALTALLRI